MYLILLALFGVIAPYGLYVIWLMTKFSSIGAALNDELAVGFAIEMAAATALLAYCFSINRLGRYGVGWFVAFSVVGGPGFAIPMFYWLNRRSPFMERTIQLRTRKIRDFFRKLRNAKAGRLLPAGV